MAVAAAAVAGVGSVIAISVGGPSQVATPTATPTPTPPPCTQTFNTGNVGSTPYYGDSVNTALQAVTSSAVICFSSGDYEQIVLYDATHSGTVTIRPADGATVADIGFDMNGVQDVTIQGFDGASSLDEGVTVKQEGVSTPSRDILLTANKHTTGGVAIIGGAASVANANIVQRGSTFIGFGGVGDETRRIKVVNMSPCPNGVVIEENEVANGTADGIQLGGTSCGTIIRRNIFHDILQATCDAEGGGAHCDPIQDAGGSVQTQILDNWIYNSSNGIVAFDGTGCNWLVAGNVLDVDVSNAITLGGSCSPTLRNNTLIGSSAHINLTSKAGQTTTNATVRDNITPGGVTLANGVGGDATVVQNNYNMCASACAGANSLTGRVLGTHYSFVGGASPTSWAGFRLADGSDGENDASDGTDIGVNP